MDRPLDTRTRRRLTASRWAAPLGVAAVTLALLALLPGWVAPSLERDEIRTARVVRGPIEATITAAGVVVPEVERVITSPITSRVERILATAGDEVHPGQALVELDLRPSILRVEGIEQELALRRNRREQLGIDLDRRLDELGTRRRLQVLSLSNLAEQTAQHRELVRLGAVSRGQLREAELAEERARIELGQLDSELENARATTRVQQEALDLEMRSLQSDLTEARRQLDLARIEADRGGVLTWVVEREGMSVSAGQEVARLADLSSFRVEATVSDVHAERLRVGMPIKVLAGEASFAGRLARVLPTVENGALRLDVSLEAAAHTVLRANQRVDVYLVTTRKAEALTLARGAYLSGGSGRQEVFVVRGDEAVRTPVEIGTTGFEACEIVKGLRAGDEVIVSDMSPYRHRARIDIR